MTHYDFQTLESKWQKRWADAKLRETPAKPVKKFYVLEEPLHTSDKIRLWQFRCFAIGDAVARFKRMQGYDVLHPLAWVSFNGMMDEFASRLKRPLPQEVAARIEQARVTLHKFGFSHDEARTVHTSDPGYYRWTQWLFLLLLNRDLLYTAAEVYYSCPDHGNLSPGLSPDRRCISCGKEVSEERIEDCWYLKWKPLAERLKKDLGKLAAWDTQAKRMQEIWLDQPHPIQSWPISRQRYWGCPIPLVMCPNCGYEPVPEAELPVRLPLDVTSYQPKGRSVLADNESFAKTACPRCKGPARRNPDTLPAYFDALLLPFRLCDSNNSHEPWDAEAVQAWGPVDLYIGAPDVHLFQMRLASKVLADAGLIPFDEPFLRLFVPGPVPDMHGCTGRYSRSRLVPAEKLTEDWGVDACRLAMFMACPSGLEYRWSEEILKGGARFVQRLIRVFQACAPLADGSPGDSSGYPHLRQKARQALQNMEEACEGSYSFHKALAPVMELCSLLSAERPNPTSDSERRSLGEVLETVCKVVAPMAPFLGEELWEILGGRDSVFKSAWPKPTAEPSLDQVVELVVQVNGKKRGKLSLSRDATEGEVLERALELVSLKGSEPKRIVFVPNKLINLVM